MSATTLAPQAQMVLDYLKTGRALSNIIALTTLKVAALPRRIADVAEYLAALPEGDPLHGYTIGKERKRDFQDAAYVAYSLKEPDGA
jgi:hypothetical protein